MSEHRKIHKKTICPLDCPDSCAMIATIEDGKVVGLAGDVEHPYTQGIICRKMKRYHERVYSEKRIYYPMKRVGKKGDAKFARITWDEAYVILTNQITATIKEYGGEAILPFVYAGNMGMVNRFAGYPLFNKLGTSRLEETICSTAAKAGWKSHCGDVPGACPEIAAEANLIIIWGSNTKVTNLHFWPYVAKAKKRGAKLVVIDPYRNITGASADIHLKVQPGGDTALALALLKILCEQKRIHRPFIDSSTIGFAELDKYLHKADLAELVQGSGVPEDLVKKLAALLADTPKCFIRLGMGMTRNSWAGMGIRAITSLAAALGLFDGAEGRGVLLTSGAYKGDPQKLTWNSLAETKTRMFNMVQLGNCLHTASPPIKMLFIYNSNPLSVTPDGSLVRKALARSDIFTVVHEQVMTPTARYADLLLPATTFLENKDIFTGYGHFYMSVADAVIEPVGEAKSNFDFFQELAAKLGYTETPFRQTIEERMVDYLATVEGLPATFQLDAIEYGRAYLSTKARKGQPLYGSGKERYSFVETSDPSLPVVPCIIDGNEFDNADYLARYPFKLIAPPHLDLLNSTFGERYDGMPGEVLIHPHDAEVHGIDDEDIITLYNDRGWVRRKAKVTTDTQKGLLVAEGLFWESIAHPSGINDLASQNLTDMGRGGTFHESRVAILEKA